MKPLILSCACWAMGMGRSSQDNIGGRITPTEADILLRNVQHHFGGRAVNLKEVERCCISFDEKGGCVTVTLRE